MKEFEEEMEMLEEKEIELIFKSFMRSQLRHLKAVEKAVQNGELAQAEKIVEELIEDTKKGIED